MRGEAATVCVSSGDDRSRDTRVWPVYVRTLPDTIRRSGPLISIVIPCRVGEHADMTVDSLLKQTRKDFEYDIVRDVERRGAPWARNRGAEIATGAYLLFSDNDISWEPEALDLMVRALESPAAMLPDANGFTTDYAYGSYRIIRNGKPGPLFCDEAWNYDTLKGRNYISTMSLMRRSAFPGWDESLKRLQDWDLWLTMAEQRSKGVYVGKMLFTTPYREGITYGNSPSYEDAFRVVRKKHGLGG